MDGMLSKRADLPDDLACFLQQQKQRQARLETTMRSFPSSLDTEMEKQDMAGKRKRNTHEVGSHKILVQSPTPLNYNNSVNNYSCLIFLSFLKHFFSFAYIYHCTIRLTFDHRYFFLDETRSFSQKQHLLHPIILYVYTLPPYLT